MKHLIPFTFESQSIRVIDQDGDPWFVLADVCNGGHPSEMYQMQMVEQAKRLLA